MRILQGGLVRWFWKGLDTKGHKKGINDWKGSQVIMQAMIVLTQKMMDIGPNNRWSKLKRWLPQWDDRHKQIGKRGSFIYMIIELTTGKVYCGETEQELQNRWYGHVTTIAKYRRNSKAGTDIMYKRMANTGMDKYCFFPW